LPAGCVPQVAHVASDASEHCFGLVQVFAPVRQSVQKVRQLVEGVSCGGTSPSQRWRHLASIQEAADCVKARRLTGIKLSRSLIQFS
jgi:hypothetical protein